MNIEQTLSQGLKQEFKITIPGNEVAGKIQSRLEVLGKNAKLKGFRPGKVPFKIIEQYYGEQAREDVLKDLVRVTSQKLITEKKLRQASDPRVHVVAYDTEKGLEYRYELELLPEIQLKDFSTLSLKKLKINVEANGVEVNGFLEELLSKHKKYQEKTGEEESVKKDDLVTIELTITREGKIWNNFDHKKIDIEVGSKEFLLADVENALKSAKVGAELTIQTTLPKDISDTKAAGQPVECQGKILIIRTPVASKLDDTFAEEFNCKNMAELREKIRESLQNHYGNMTRLHLKRYLLDALASQYDFPLPLSLVEAEFKIIWERLQEELEKAKNRGDITEEEDSEESDEELKKQYHAIAERRVRLGLIISEVGKTQGIQLTDTELRNAVMAEALRYSGHEKEVIEFYRKTPQAVDRLRAPLMEEKVIDFILTKVKLEECEVNAPELKSAVEGIIPTEDSLTRQDKELSSKEKVLVNT